MGFRKTLLMATCILSSASLPYAHAESSATVKVLLDKARSLAAHGHLDIAVQTWQQILLSDANNLEALRGIASADLKLGRSQEAHLYLERLRKAGGTQADIAHIQGMEGTSTQGERLTKAGNLAKAGQYAQAMQIYREVFGDNPPSGDWALAYYDTEAATENGRAHAIAGLRELVRQFPAEQRYSITLGRVLTYNPKTRAEGIAILRRYDTLPAADDALRQALAWEAQAGNTAHNATGRGADFGAPGAGASNHESSPGDNPAYGAGYRALNSGDLAGAEQKFQSVLAREPQDQRALAGMGFVKMKAQAFSDAARFFDQAITAGNHERAVSDALATSRFWDQMQRAGQQAKDGDLETAVKGYQQALAIRSDSPEALEGLGGALLKAGKPEDAIAPFERALALNGNSAVSWRGLLAAQSQAHRVQEALSTAERIPASLRQTLEKDPDFLSTLAADYAASGDQAVADRIVKRALSMPLPDAMDNLPVSKQMQYASLLMMARRYNAAARMYQGVVAADPENGDAWRALISVHHQLGQDAEAMRDLQRMPEEELRTGRKDPAFLVLVASVYQSQNRLEDAQKYLEAAIAHTSSPSVALQNQLASVYMAQGDGQQAYRLYEHALEASPDSLDAWRGLLGSLHQMHRDREALEQMSSIPSDLRAKLEQDPGYLETTAGIRTSLGQTRQALESFSRLNAIYASSGSDRPADTLIEEGWLLLDAGDDAQLYRTIERLASKDHLTEPQENQFNKLWVSWTVRKARRSARAGDSRRALSILEASARAFPGNAMVEGALADAYLESGQAKRALALYSTLDMTQASADLYQAAVGAALAAHDRRQAELWLETALGRYGQDPKILQLAAQFEQDRGDARKAAAYYRAALRAMGPQTQAELIADNDGNQAEDGPRAATNPREQLLEMLAPLGTRHSSNDGEAESTRTGHDLRSSLLSEDLPVHRTLADLSDENDPPVVRSGLRQARVGASDADPEQSTPTRSLPAPRFTEPAKEPSSAPAETTASEPLHTARSTTEMVPEGPQHPRPKVRETVRIRPTSFTLPFGTAPEYLQVQSAEVKTQSHLMAAVADGSDEDGTANSRGTQKEVRQLRGEAPGSVADDDAGATLWPLRAGAESRVPRRDKADEDAAAEPLPPLTGSSSSHAMVRTLTAREQDQDRLAAIESASTGWLGGTSSLDYHSGQPGYDRLTIFGSQVEASSMLGSGARLTTLVGPVLLDGGSATSDATFRQGTLPAETTPYIQTAAGVGGEIQLRTRSVGAALGYTPHGFLIENPTGRLMVRPDAGPVTFSFERQPVEDTQLSYAGLRDLGSRGPSYDGNVWGGVISNAAELQVARGDGNSGWYFQGGGQYLTGRHVPTNNRIDGDAGSYWAVWSKPDSGTLTIGANFFGMHYAHNLRYFTYGQGGYFSPAAYMLGNVPIGFTGHYGRNFHYQASGSLGVQAFQEDSAAYYPLDPALQAATPNAYYAERTSVGGNYNVNAEGAYAIADHWYVGASVSLNNSRDYKSSRVGFFVRFTSKSQTPDAQLGPTGILPNQGLRPLLLP